MTEYEYRIEYTIQRGRAEMSDYTPSVADGQSYYVAGRAQIQRQITGEHAQDITPYSYEFDRMIAQVRAETVEYVAQIATDTLRMCQAGGVGEKNILPLQQEVGFQLCIDNIANLAKSMKGEGQ